MKEINTRRIPSDGIREVIILPPVHDLSRQNHRQKSIEIWRRRNNDILGNRAMLSNGADFFNIWQAGDQTIFQNFLFEENFGTVTERPSDSFNLWSPFSIMKSDKGRLRVFPKTSRNRVMSWQRKTKLFN